MCVHFIGFRGDEYTNAVRVWGRPDFFHYVRDARVAGDVAPGDVVVCANNWENKWSDFTFNDSDQHFGDRSNVR